MLILQTMGLEQYLQALELCPDELVECRGGKIWRLTADYGIYDNWPILLNHDLDKIVSYLRASKYQQVAEQPNIGVNHLRFTYRPGMVVLQLINLADLGKVTDSENPDMSEEARRHFEKQKEFNLKLMLHPYQDSNITGLNWTRALAVVAQDIGQYALINNVPLCFPNSIGWKNLYDYSQVVYHP